jgi:glycosyltransferase involved in cell wall biosynthesis
MKILFGYRYGILGGVCTQLINRLAGFSRMPGMEVHFAFVKDYGISGVLGSYPHVLYAPEPDALRPYCEEAGIDAISIIDTPEMLDAVEGITTARKTFLEVHTTYDVGLEYLEDRRLAVDAVLVPSRYSERLVKERLASSTPIYRLQNCVDPESFSPLDRRPPAVPIVLWVGKLDDHKNWRGFLEIAARLAERVPEVAFWLVGGATASAEAKEEFVEERRRAGLERKLHWARRIPYSVMPDIYRLVAASGGLHLVTSRDESFGMSVAESLLCGCPVVASRVGALPEL